jgi:oxygen-independent coproporphyrinogen-3 oxidase
MATTRSAWTIHYARRGDNLALAARSGQLHRNFQGQTTGWELELLERGLVVRDPAVLERFAPEWLALQELVLDGLVELSEARGRGLARVTLPGRWLIRTIAAVFDPEQARRASGSRLV